jgi:type IV secretory pathway VirB2 component (pilin)
MHLPSALIITVILTLIFPELSLAQQDTNVGNMLCTAASWIDGNAGHGIITLSVIIMGILALLNKISWNFALLHIVGTALLVGASSMVSALNAGGSGC